MGSKSFGQVKSCRVLKLSLLLRCDSPLAWTLVCFRWFSCTLVDPRALSVTLLRPRWFLSAFGNCRVLSVILVRSWWFSCAVQELESPQILIRIDGSLNFRSRLATNSYALWHRLLCAHAHKGIKHPSPGPGSIQFSFRPECTELEASKKRDPKCFRQIIGNKAIKN